MHPTARAYKGQPRIKVAKTLLDQTAELPLELAPLFTPTVTDRAIEEKLLTTNVSKDKLAAANALSDLIAEYREKLERSEPLDQVACLQIHARMFALHDLYESLDF